MPLLQITDLDRARMHRDSIRNYTQNPNFRWATWANPHDAPAGYKPVLKRSLADAEGNCDNYCNHCDWRKDCDPKVCRCQDHARRDGASVVFKKLEVAS